MKKKPARKPSSELQGVVTRNIETVLRIKKEDEERRTVQQKTADQISHFTGSLYFVYFHLVLVTTWIFINLGKIPGIRPFDPYPFTLLAVTASVEAIFLSTFVLLSQNRLKEMEDKRDNLDLQINLLAEHEITKLIQLTQEIAKKVGVDPKKTANLEEIKKETQPEEVLEKIEECENNIEDREAS